MASHGDQLGDQLGAQLGEQLDYDIVDVFTDRPYAGNPLSVVHGASGLSTGQLQALAREFNLSETAFPTVRPGAAAYDVRIFTASEEIPFAGHPTLGTGWLLRRRSLLGADQVVQHGGSGQVAVTVWDTGAELAALPSFLDRRDDTDQLAAAVGLVGADVEQAAYEAGCGLGWAVLRVRPDAVARARPPTAGWRVRGAGPDPIGGLCVCAYRREGAAVQVHARVFCPDVGITEDPGTGSAAAALGLVLVADQTAPGDGCTAYTVAQGAEIGRPSTLSGRVDAEAGAAVLVHVAGGVVPVASGRIAVPPVEVPG